MIDPVRHVPLREAPWSESDAAAAIEEIVADALAHLDGERFWPAHPQDDGIEDGHASVYCGATGMIWAIDYLACTGATAARFDFRPLLPRLMEASRAELPGDDEYAVHGSLLFGELCAALTVMRLAPTEAIADLIHTRAEANNGLPLRELMWGTAGSMLACIHMAAMTAEPRWPALYATQAARLLADLAETPDGPLWTQDLYGKHLRFLGPVHGYAGNMIALMRGWDWLDDDPRGRVADAVPRTLATNAWRSDLGATWHAVVERGRPPWLCQHCHGAPGMVTALADAPFSAPELEPLLCEGGQFVWAAGPLAKGSNLCHGTGGNGYAFLKLWRRTKDPIWLERARAFAMTAIAQCREARSELGRGRYSLSTGDTGLAVYLWDCITGEPRFPTIDVF